MALWTGKKNINLFQKKLVFIPVNADLHWLLCVVVNPGLIANNLDSDFDTSKEHALKVSSSSFLVGIFCMLHLHWFLLSTLSIVGIFCMLQHLFAQVHTSIFDSILFLDSLEMHDANDYARCIHKWLNYEWKRLGQVNIGRNSPPIDADSLPLVSPNSRFCSFFLFQQAGMYSFSLHYNQ